MYYTDFSFVVWIAQSITDNEIKTLLEESFNADCCCHHSLPRAVYFRYASDAVRFKLMC